MTVRYSTNWMGVASLQWYRDRGLVKRSTITLTEDNPLTGRKAGDSFEYDEVTESYSCGRIDCRGDGLGQFGDELGVDPMKNSSWAQFSKWLYTFETDDLWTMNQLIELYEKTNPKIEWWVE